MLIFSFICLQGIASAFSALLLVLWCLNTFRWHSEHSSPLQHFMTLALIFRFINDISNGFIYLFFEDNSIKKYFVLLENMSFTLYHTFLYSSFLLLSKGYSTTRHIITQGQLTMFTLSMSLIYIVFSIYMINPRALSFLFLLTILVMIYYCTKYNASTIQKIDRQLHIFQRLHIEEMYRTTLGKRRMIRTFRVLCHIYFFIESVTLVLIEAGLGSEYIFGIETCYALLGEFAVGGIYFTFRARALGQFFRVGEMGSFSEDEEWQPPVLYQSRPELSNLTTETEHFPIVVIVPAPKEDRLFPYQHYEIGVLEGLTQPLL